MQKHLHLYPLIFALMLLGVAACALQLIRLLYIIHQAQPHPGAQLVWRAVQYASA